MGDFFKYTFKDGAKTVFKTFFQTMDNPIYKNFIPLKNEHGIFKDL